MQYDFNRSIEILERTPAVLTHLLQGINETWVMNNEGPDTFSPFDVVGHLIHGERTDWMERTSRILQHGTAMPFDKYDRFAQYEESKGKSINELLDTFASLRKQNLQALAALNLDASDLDKKGMHPALGEVTLKNLLATWVVHDLTHIAQITRVMAKQYKEEAGPWKEFFRILDF
jgi:hypothetical protein